jgi:hypothetical protein
MFLGKHLVDQEFQPCLKKRHRIVAALYLKNSFLIHRIGLALGRDIFSLLFRLAILERLYTSEHFFVRFGTFFRCFSNSAPLRIACQIFCAFPIAPPATANVASTLKKCAPCATSLQYLCIRYLLSINKFGPIQSFGTRCAYELAVGVVRHLCCDLCRMGGSVLYCHFCIQAESTEDQTLYRKGRRKK